MGKQQSKPKLNLEDINSIFGESQKPSLSKSEIDSIFGHPKTPYEQTFFRSETDPFIEDLVIKSTPKIRKEMQMQKPKTVMQADQLFMQDMVSPADAVARPLNQPVEFQRIKNWEAERIAKDTYNQEDVFDPKNYSGKDLLVKGDGGKEEKTRLSDAELFVYGLESINRKDLEGKLSESYRERENLVKFIENKYNMSGDDALEFVSTMVNNENKISEWHEGVFNQEDQTYDQSAIGRVSGLDPKTFPLDEKAKEFKERPGVIRTGLKSFYNGSLDLLGGLDKVASEMSSGILNLVGLEDAAKAGDLTTEMALKKLDDEIKADVSEFESTTAQILGQAVPSAIPIFGGIAVSASGNPVLGGRIAHIGFGGLTLAAGGNYLHEYDQYKQSKGEEENAFEKYAGMVGTMAVEYVTERAGLGGDLVSGSQRVAKGVSKLSVEESVELGKQVLRNYAANNPAKFKQYAKSILVTGNREGASEAAATLGQESIADTYKDIKDQISDWDLGKRMLESYAVGSLIGGAVGPISYKSNENLHRERREGQGGVIIAEYDGQGVEIIREAGDKIEVMTPEGKVMKVEKGEVSNSVTLSLGQFDNILKSKEVETDTIEQSRLELEAVQRDQKNHAMDLATDGMISENQAGQAVVEVGMIGENAVLVDPNETSFRGSIWVRDINTGSRHNVRVEEVENIEAVPVAEFRNEVLGELAYIPSDLEGVPQRGEVVNHDFFGSGVIKGYDPRNGESVVQFDKDPQNEKADEGPTIPFPRSEIDQMRELPDLTAAPTQARFDEGGDPIITPQEVRRKDQLFKEGLQLSNDKKPLKVINNRISGLKKSDAEKLSIDIMDEYPNLGVEVVDSTPKNDPEARANWEVKLSSTKQESDVKTKTIEVEQEDEIKQPDKEIEASEQPEVKTKKQQKSKKRKKPVLDDGSDKQETSKPEGEEEADTSEPPEGDQGLADRDTSGKQSRPKKSIDEQVREDTDESDQGDSQVSSETALPDQGDDTQSIADEKATETRDVVEQSRSELQQTKQSDETNANTARVDPMYHERKKAVESIAKKFMKKWKDGPELVVFESKLDAQLLINQLAREGVIDGFVISNDVSGFQIADTIYMVSSALKPDGTHKFGFEGSKPDENEVYDTLLHEAVGHYGLRSMVGSLTGKNEEFKQLLESVRGDMETDRLNQISTVYIGESFENLEKGSEDYYTVLEEYVAHEAQKPATEEKSIVQRVIDWIQKQLSVVNVELEDQTLQSVIHNSRRFLNTGKSLKPRPDKELAPVLQIQFQMNTPIEKTGDLVALHNIEPRGVLNADKQGGLPMPSLAIIKDDLPFDKYGSISLVADTELVDPQIKGNQTFGADVYSPRYPAVKYFASQGELLNRFGEYESDLPIKEYRMTVDNLANEMENGGIDAAKRHDLLRYAYLKETGKEIPELKTKDKPFVSEELLEYVRARKEEKYYDIVDAAQDEEFTRLVKESQAQQFRKGGIGEAEIKELNKGELKQWEVSNTMRSIDQNLKEDPEYDTFEFFSDLRKATDSEEFSQWVEDQMASINIDEKLFAGFTPSGKRRYMEHNLDNVMKLLKKEDVRAGEGFSYGPGMARAAYTPKFRSVEQIVRAKDKILSNEDFEKVREEINEEFFELRDKLATAYQFDSDNLGFSDTVIDLLVEARKGGIANTFNQYGFDLTESHIEAVSDYIDKLKTTPTEYFESIPKRVVGLSEFRGAIIEEGTPQDVVDVLESSNLKVVSYDKSVEGDRQAKLNQFLDENSDIRFQRNLPSVSDAYYSNAQKVIDEIPEEKATGGQWKQILLNRGVENDMLKWIDFDEFIDRNNKFTKDELREFIRSKEISVAPSGEGLLLMVGEEAVAGAEIDGNSIVVDSSDKSHIKEVIRYASLNGFDSVVAEGIEDVAKELDSTVEAEDNRMQITPLMDKLFIEQSQPMLQKSITVGEEGAVRMNWLDKRRVTLQDAMLYVLKLQELKKKEGGVVEDYMDSWAESTLHKGRIKYEYDNYRRAHFNPLIKHIDKITGSGLTLRVRGVDIPIKPNIVGEGQVKNYDMVHKYLKAKHIVEDNVEKGGDIKIDGKVVDPEVIVKSFEETVPKKDVKKLNQMIQAMVHLDRQLKYEYGLITEKQFRDLTTQFTHYVPLKGWDSIIDQDETVTTDIKKRKGRTTESADPIPYIDVAIHSTIIKGEKNKFKRSFLEFAKHNPDFSQYQIRNVWYVKGDQGWRIELTTPSKELIKSGDATRVAPDVEAMTETEREYYATQGLKNQGKGLTVLIDGRKVVLDFRDDRLVKAFEKQPMGSENVFINAWATLYNWMRAVRTQYSPEFAPVNFIRDATFGINNIRVDHGTKVAAKVAGDIASSFLPGKAGDNSAMRVVKRGVFNEDYTGEGKWYKEYLEAGAAIGWTDLQEIRKIYNNVRSEVEGVVKIGRLIGGMKILNAVDNINQVIETTTRFAAYRVLRKGGMSQKEAAIYAKDLTVNFNRKGNSSDFWNRWFMFFNAGIQGGERLLRPFNSSSGKVRRRAWGSAAMFMAGHAMMTTLARAVGGYDEDGISKYDKLSEYTRAHNLIIPNFFADENDADWFIKIPLPYGLNFFCSIADHAMRLTMPVVTGKPKIEEPSEAALALLENATTAFIPIDIAGADSDLTLTGKILKSVFPTAAKPQFELFVNENFAGRQIFKEPYSVNELEKPDSQMYFRNVTPAFREAAEWMNEVTGGSHRESGHVDINPETIEHLWQSYTGGVGTFLSNTLTTSQNLIDGGMPNAFDAESRNLSKVPFVRRFTATDPSFYHNQNRFYESTDEIKKAADIYKGYKKDVRNRMEGAKELRDDFKKRNAVMLRNDVQRRAERMRERIADLRDDKNLATSTGNEKKAREAEMKMNKLFIEFELFLQRKRQ